jgi:hypothetical protein
MKYLKTFEEISFLKNIFKRKTGEVIIRPMKKSDVQKCLDLKFQYFGHF